MRYGIGWAWLWVGAAVLASCGGKTVVEPTGSGGSGAASSSNMSSSASGPSGCMDHQDCESGEVCLFGTGACVPSCGPDFCEACEPGTICNDCATASCPGCADCVSACVPIAAGQCDDNDPCTGAGEVCVWGAAVCAPTCDANGGCPSDLDCQECATGSCCGCDDCVSVCVPI